MPTFSLEEAGNIRGPQTLDTDVLSLESADPEGFWENVYGLFRACHLLGVFLPGQLDLGCGHHGI